MGSVRGCKGSSAFEIKSVVLKVSSIIVDLKNVFAWVEISEL